MMAASFSRLATRRFVASAAALAVLLIASMSVATTVLIVGIPELGRRATLIVEGHVEATSVVSLKAGPGIFTDSTIAVSTTHKGSNLTELVVRVPGGHLNGRTTTIEGMPSLTPGTDVLLFLEPLPISANPDGLTRYLPLGLTQGHMILRDHGEQPYFERARHLGGVVANHAYCTGGEHERRFDVKSMRRWLRDTFSQGDRP